jgi:hypothetical protein
LEGPPPGLGQVAIQEQVAVGAARKLHQLSLASGHIYAERDRFKEPSKAVDHPSVSSAVCSALFVRCGTLVSPIDVVGAPINFRIGAPDRYRYRCDFCAPSKVPVPIVLTNSESVPVEVTILMQKLGFFDFLARKLKFEY